MNRLAEFLFDLRILLVYGWGPASRHPGRFGRTGERIAELFLRREGLCILGRRFRFPGGEVDLIASDGVTVVLVEVKTRRERPGREIGEDLREAQRLRLERAAPLFLREKGLVGRPWRTDAIEIVWRDGRRPRRPRIRWIRHWGAGPLEGEPVPQRGA